MNTSTQFAALSAPDQWLVRQLQNIAFGRLTFSVRRGAAHPSDGFSIARTRKLLGDESKPRPQTTREDFALRAEQAALLEHVRALPDGTRVTVKIAMGLPTTSIDIEEDHRAA